MENREGIYKTSQQLANQVRQVNIYRLLRQKAEPLNKDQSDYAAYLDSLRSLRKFQHNHFLEQQKHSEQVLTEPEYFESNYDPNLAKLVLDRLLGDRQIGNLDLQKLAEITQDENTFVNLLSTYTRSPGSFTRTYFPILENTIPEDRFKQDIGIFVNSQKSTHDFFLVDRDIGLPKVLKYVSKEEVKNVFHTIAEKQEDKQKPNEVRTDSMFLEHLLDIQNIGLLFNDQELHDLVKIYVEKHTNILLRKEDLEPLIKRGILDQSILEKLVFQSLKSIDCLYTAFRVLPYTPQVTKEKVHDTLKEVFSETTHHQALESLKVTVEYLSEEERLTIAKRLIQTDPNRSWVTITSDLREVFSSFSWNEIIGIMVNHPDLRYFEEARKIIMYTKGLNPNQKYDLFKQLQLNYEQLKKKTTAKTRDKMDLQGLFEEYRDNAKGFIEQFPSDKRAEIAEIVIKEVPSTYFYSIYRDCVDFLDGSTLVKLMNDALQDKDPTKLHIFINSLEDWIQKIEDQSLLELVERIAANAPEWLYQVDTLYPLAKRFSSGQIESFTKMVSFENPFLVLKIIDELKAEGIIITPFEENKVLEVGFTNQQKIDFAPKLLRDIFHQLSATTNVKIKAALIQNGEHIYEQIKAIQQAGFEQNVKKILARESLTLKQESELIDTFYGYAHIKNRQPSIFEGLDLDIEKLGFSEAKIFLFKVINRRFGLEHETDINEIRQFLAAMESPTPFLIYLAQYFESEEHFDLLKKIYDSLIKGRFKEWKYGGVSDETLAELKAAHLLPEQLTIQQYQQWQQDEETTLYDTLSVDSKEVADHITQYLKDNLEHLAISHLINKAAIEQNLESFDDLKQNIQDSIRSAGEALQRINEQLKVARKEGNVELISSYEQTQSEGELKRKDLLRARTIIRLMNLDHREISSGTFLEGKDKNQKGEILTKVLDRLKEQALPDDAFVYDEVKRFLSQVQGGSDSSQNILCSDSSNPKVMFEIGETPVASCQNYDSGGYNSCLLGYSEPSTKIIIVRNSRGNIIARSIFRMLTASDGKQTLHVERIYSSVASKTIPRSIYTHALNKAQEMGLRVVVSKISKTETGDTEEALPAPEFSLKSVPFSLQAISARAPNVYVDSAGGMTNGKYELENLLEIRRTSNVHSS